MVRITVIDAPDQIFSLVLAGRRVTMRLRYNVTTERWSFDLSLDEEPVIIGRRIVPGVDLLAPFNLGLGAFFAADPSGQGREPGRYELPKGLVRLYHGTEEEFAAAHPPPVVIQESRPTPEIVLPEAPAGFSYLTDDDEEGSFLLETDNVYLIMENA